MTRILLSLLFAFATFSANAADPILRWSSAGDVLTFDYHAAADTFSQNVGD